MMEEDEQLETVSDQCNSQPMLATHTVTELEDAASSLLVEEPEREIQSWLNLSAVLTARVRQIRQRVEQVAVEWIKQNGPVRLGDIEYTVGHANYIHCTDVPGCAKLILEASGGDFAGVVDHLRADPFKYGAVRHLLGEPVFNGVFMTEPRPKLVAGVPQLQLRPTNLRYLSPRRAKTKPRDTSTCPETRP